MRWVLFVRVEKIMKVRNMVMGRVWDGMLCTCVSEEGGYVEGVDSEESSLLSYSSSSAFY